jgi:hypothetical protein
VPKLPLVRLKIAFSEAHNVINMARFGAEYKGLVANVNNFLFWWRRPDE